MSLSSPTEKILERHKQMKAAKQPWLLTYQMIGRYVMTRKQDFTDQHSPGQFLTGELFDSTAAAANHLMAATLIGNLWPNGAKSFRLAPPDGLPKEVSQRSDVKKWYEDNTRKLVNAMDEPTAGLLTSFEELMKDLGAFGISGLGAWGTDDLQYPLRFTATDAKRMCVSEGESTRIDTVYIEEKITIRQLVQRYGIENVSTKSREAYNKDGMEQKVVVLHVVEPRQDAPGGFGNKNMPVASIHIEVEAKHTIKVSGYEEMPVLVPRFWKITGEEYGRSPAMETMPNIIEINAKRENTIVAEEKILDPPLWIHDEANGTIDTSAGAITFKRQTGRAGDNGKSIEQIVTVGDMNPTYKRITELEEIIKRDFFIDLLTDLNNTQRMTAYETSVRNEIRGQSLGSVYSRLIAELLYPLVIRCFNILYRLGLMGVVKGSPEAEEIEMSLKLPDYIPDEIAELIAEGKEAYKVIFISPAARILRAEELTGIERFLMKVVEIAQIKPDILDNIDFDETLRIMQELSGAPPAMLRSMEAIEEIRQQQAQQQQAMMEMQSQQVMADTAKSAGMAMASASKAGQAA